jgi:cystathionine beta-lyase
MVSFNTLAVHGAGDPDPLYGAAVPPLYLTTTYRNERFGEPPPYGYSRGANPTRARLERLAAELHGARHGFALASGQAASAAALAVLGTGRHVLLTRDVYGGTVGLLDTFFADFGLTYSLVDTSDLTAVEAAWTEGTAAVFVETPSNPLLNVTDIRAIAALAHQRGALAIVDNTFLSPYLQRPLELGADIVVESATKFLGGHSDVIAGIAVTDDDALAAKIKSFQVLGGGIAQPFDAYLVLRGLKTLGVRIDRQQQTTAAVVAHLQGVPGAERLRYPGLESHPGHGVNQAQAAGAGSLFSFELAAGHRLGAFLDALRVFTHGASLGAVESLVQNPATGSHAQFSPERRAEFGIPENLVRVSIGLEDAPDLIADLDQAFAAARTA